MYFSRALPFVSALQILMFALVDVSALCFAVLDSSSAQNISIEQNVSVVNYAILHHVAKFRSLAPEYHIPVNISAYHLDTVHLISFIMSLGVTSDMSVVDTEWGARGAAELRSATPSNIFDERVVYCEGSSPNAQLESASSGRKQTT